MRLRVNKAIKVIATKTTKIIVNGGFSGTIFGSGLGEGVVVGVSVGAGNGLGVGEGVNIGVGDGLVAKINVDIEGGWVVSRVTLTL